MCKTIATASELVNLAPVGSKFDASFFCNFIDIEEESLFNECLGYDFWNYLKNDLNELPLAKSFKSGSAYIQNDYVINNNIIYKCLTDGVYDNIYNSSFIPFKKFKTDINNVLWYDYLGYLLASLCVYQSVTFKTFDYTNIGLMRNKTENSDSATAKDLSIYRYSLEGRIKKIMDNLDKFLKRNFSNFKLYLGNFDNKLCCEEGKKCSSNKSFGFNV